VGDNVSCDTTGVDKVCWRGALCISLLVFCLVESFLFMFIEHDNNMKALIMIYHSYVELPVGAALA